MLRISTWRRPGQVSESKAAPFTDAWARYCGDDRPATDAEILPLPSGTRTSRTSLITPSSRPVRLDERYGSSRTTKNSREMRHSFVSVLSDSEVPLEDISRLVGHAGTLVTEKVYRHQIRPVLLAGAEAMGDVFPASAPVP